MLMAARWRQRRWWLVAVVLMVVVRRRSWWWWRPGDCCRDGWRQPDTSAALRLEAEGGGDERVADAEGASGELDGDAGGVHSKET